uniref:CACTA transposable element n=1 Tax=Dahlia pinnata TaxID=101596 RepID=E3WHA2_DAHPI|nr:CACTA transposable element [Dahlia pinnata]
MNTLSVIRFLFLVELTLNPKLCFSCMIMSVDKSWLSIRNRRSPEYEQGLTSFIEMCKEHVDSRGYVRCACAKCQNTLLIPFIKMKYHMHAYGILRTYDIWTYHGESLIPAVVVVDDVAPTNDMAGVIEDVMYERMEEDINLDEGNLGTESSGGCDDFEYLLKEVQSELYPGCTKFSSLDFLAKLMHIKVKNKWTNSSFDELLELLQSSHPEGNKIPPSHYVAKKTLKKIGLGYESIHVCKNDCALFWKEHHSLHNCPVCNESRWVDTNTKGKKVPHKVLRYFPLTPRLRRLYCSRHTAKDMIWHSTGRSEEGTMRHPVDGSSWKEFDIRYPNFSREPRNVRLGLAADGFNPFGNMSSAHSTWPVVLTTYNLPPWLCMKESSFMLSLLIPGPKSPGKDMDVFLKPLVDELNYLWQSGVRTKDAATNTFFTMKVALLWTINDFPARSSLSGWSGQGYKACPTCNENTPSIRVTNKVVYVGHRRFLDVNHVWRTSLDFNGEPETRAPPKPYSHADIEAQLSRLLHRLPGKHPDFGGVTRKREEFELNWSKRSIFFELEYWSSLQLKHNLDVMHIERNVCDSLLGTLLMNDKTKDTPNARIDLENLKTNF